VRQTGESVVVGDARTDERFANAPYIVSTKPRSILCVPIVHHGTLGGMLYLEHQLASDAFTADRLAMMHILAAQAAISLADLPPHHFRGCFEKARGYSDFSCKM
jgi:GAF domain-containing protein